MEVPLTAVDGYYIGDGVQVMTQTENDKLDYSERWSQLVHRAVVVSRRKLTKYDRANIGAQRWKCISNAAVELHPVGSGGGGSGYVKGGGLPNPTPEGRGGGGISEKAAAAVVERSQERWRPAFCNSCGNKIDYTPGDVDLERRVR